MKQLALLALLTTFVTARPEWNNLYPEEVIRGNYKNEPSHYNLKITGGDEAEPHAFPWQVALFIPVDGGTVFCGGSLISQQTVLTSARCLDQPISSVIEIVLGAHRVRDDEPTQVRTRSREYLIYPNYDNVTVHNDIGLVFLPEPIELNENIQIVPLPKDGNHYVEEIATVSGWGKDSDSALTISPVLRKVDLKIITNVVCDIMYLGQIIDSQLCTEADQGRSTCEGDSGGALVHSGVQVGIASFSVNHGCEAGWPAVFTRVSSYVVWINFNIR